MDNKKTVYVIAGPTAVGKSAVALDLAKKLEGEIINCDSVQLYKYMDIGSAKPTEDEMDLVKHHLFSIIEPDYNMTVATYQKLAIACIENILMRNKTPIIVGGTGLYLNSLLYDMDFAGKVPDHTMRRNELEEMAAKNGSEYMYEYLAAIHPESADRIHPNNSRKIIRAIEAYESGNAIKPLDKCPLSDKYNFRLFILNTDRDMLYQKINSRVDKLVENGLVEEVKQLMEKGYSIDNSSMKAIGYKEIIEYLEGRTDLDTAIDNIKKDTRHFAKRQLTWFRRYDFANWIDIDSSDSTSTTTRKIINEILKYED